MIHKHPPGFKMCFLYSHTLKKVIPSKTHSSSSCVKNVTEEIPGSISAFVLGRWSFCLNIYS